MSDGPDATPTAPHGEGRRALIATALGLALGAIAAIFMHRKEPDRARRRLWRGRSAT